MYFFNDFFSITHIKQIKETKMDWFLVNDDDKFIYAIVNIAFAIFEKAPMPSAFEQELIEYYAVILAAADYLSTKKFNDINRAFAKIPEYRKKLLVPNEEFYI